MAEQYDPIFGDDPEPLNRITGRGDFPADLQAALNAALLCAGISSTIVVFFPVARTPAAQTSLWSQPNRKLGAEQVHNLWQTLTRCRKAIEKVEYELTATRNRSAKFWTLSAPNAHRLALEFALQLCTEVFRAADPIGWSQCLIDSKANFDYEKIETNFPAVCKHLQSLNLPKTARLTTAIEREAAMAWDRRRAGGKATDEHQERQVAGAKPDLAGDRGTGMGKRNRKQRKYTPRLTPIQIQVYERIRHEHLPRSNYADTVERLMEDNAFLEQFREAEFKGGQKLTRKFVRKAIAYFDMRNRRTNNQQTKLL